MSQPEQQFGKLFRMEASRTSLLIVNGAGAVFGSGLIYFLITQRAIFEVKAFVVAVILLLLYLLFDYLQWNKNGIRVVEVDQEGLIIYRGNKMEETKIKATEIRDIDVFSKINRKVVNIILEGGKRNVIIPGLITTFSGNRIRITNDAFEDDEFEVFVGLVEKMKPL